MRIVENAAGSGAGGGYDGDAYIIIRTADDADIDFGWILADRRNVFDALSFNLYGLTINNLTSTAAFDDATDSLALAQNADFVADVNASDYLFPLALAGSAMGDYGVIFSMNVDTATNANSNFSVSSEDGFPVALEFSEDGTRMYMLGGQNNRIYQYSLTTAFDVTTASYDSVSLTLAAQDTSPQGMTWSVDGTRMYMIGGQNDRIYQYSLTTGFDLSTASYDSVFFSVSAQDQFPTGVAISRDGTRIYVAGDGTDAIYQYNLSTAFDLTTASYSGNDFDAANGLQVSVLSDISINADGQFFYVTSADTNDGRTVTQYSMSTPFDLSTASYTNRVLNANSVENLARDVAFSADGTRLFIVGNQNDTVYTFTGTATDGGVIVQQS